MHPAITDEQILSLIPRCQRGETAAMEDLYDLYADRLYRYALARTGDPDVAADLTTEVFVRVIQRIGRYRLNRSRPAASMSAWLYRITANLITDQYRSQGKLPQVGLSQHSLLPSQDLEPHRTLEQQETLQALSQAIGKLSEDQRLVIIGKFAENMSNAQVAAWLGKTEGAVKSLQHRALRTLGRLLSNTEN